VHQGLPEGAQAPHIQMIRYQFDEKVKNSIHLLYRYNNSAGILAVCVNFSLINCVERVQHVVFTGVHTGNRFSAKSAGHTPS
jgi:hypothetical protein